MDTNSISMSKNHMKKMIQFYEWLLKMVEHNEKDTGKIGFAELIVYKQAKKFLADIKGHASYGYNKNEIQCFCGYCGGIGCYWCER